MLPHKQIELRLQQAVRAVLPDADSAAVLVRPCPDPKFGDYQVNALMSLAKARKLNPRQLATDVLAKLDVSELCEKVEIAGAGFLNFRLKISALTQTLEAAARGEHLFFDKAARPRTVVIDFSSPNVAKPMHVGHIRSTILGDCLARTLRLLGHRVITDNHIGDWGTQFGMLLVGWKRDISNRDALESRSAWRNGTALQTGQRRAEKTESDLGGRPAGTRQASERRRRKPAIWHEMIALSQNQFDEIYARLGVKFDQTSAKAFTMRGSSRSWTNWSPKASRAKAKAPWRFSSTTSRSSNSIPRSSAKATAGSITRPPIWPRWHTGSKPGSRTKSFTSPTAASNCISSRSSPRSANGSRHQRRTPNAPGLALKLAHVWFGSILGEDGKPFKTRSGETVKLADLLDEAEERAFKIVSEKNPDLPEAQRREIARVVGLGAVKYADLLPNRQSDYVFSWDKMLALNGNTAPYLQYAYTRIREHLSESGGNIEHPNIEHRTSN